MAGDWMKVELATPDKPEVVFIAAKLGIDQDSAVGKLFRIWSWADMNSVDGNAMPVTTAFLDRLSNCPGFAAAMRDAHWLEGRDGALTFPRFDRHNGQSAKRRALTKDRVERHRKGENAASVTGALPERENSTTHTKPPAGESQASGGEPPSLADVEAEGEASSLDLDVCRIWFDQMTGVAWKPEGKPMADWRGYLKAFCRKWIKNQRPGTSPATDTSRRTPAKPTPPARSSCESPRDTRPESEIQRQGAIFRLRECLEAESPLEGRRLALARADWALLGPDVPADLANLIGRHQEVVG